MARVLRASKRTIYRTPMPILFLIVFVDLVGFGLIIPLLPFYGVRFGASPTEVTWMLAIYSLMQLFPRRSWAGSATGSAGGRC